MSYQELKEESVKRRPQVLFNLSEEVFLKRFQKAITLNKNGLLSITEEFPIESFMAVFMDRFVYPTKEYGELLKETEKISVAEFAQRLQGLFEKKSEELNLAL
jgi:hypothetical protein